MSFCTICSLNGKENVLYELFPLRSIDKTRCAWCWIHLENSLKATFNMVLFQPQNGTTLNHTTYFESICDSCQSIQNIKSVYIIQPKRFVDCNVNVKIICKWCTKILSYNVETDSVYIDISTCKTYDSTTSIEREKSVVRKLFDNYCCCNCS